MAQFNYMDANSLPIMIEDGQQICTADGQRYIIVQNVNNGVNNGNQNSVVTYSAFNDSETPVYSHQGLISSQSSALERGPNVYILEPGEIASPQGPFKTESSQNFGDVSSRIIRAPKGVSNPNERKTSQWIVGTSFNKAQLTMNNQTQKTVSSLTQLDDGRVPKPRSRFPSPVVSQSPTEASHGAPNIIRTSTPRHTPTQTVRLTNLTPNLSSIGPPKPTPRPPLRGDSVALRRNLTPRSPMPRQSTSQVRQYMECLSERIKNSRPLRMPGPSPQQQHHQLQQIQQKQHQMSQQQLLALNNSLKRPGMNSPRPRLPLTPQKQVTAASTPRPAPPCPVTPDSSPEKMDTSYPSTPEKSGTPGEQKSPSDNDAGSESFVYLQRTIKDPTRAIVQQQVSGSTVKMLVVLASGEQRLITFDIPAEECTVQDLLEQINIPFNGQTIVSLVTDAALNINYIVESEAGVIHTMHDTSDPSEQTESPANSQAPEDSSPPHEEPKYVEGKSALCPYCGTHSYDFNRCYKCKKSLPSDSRQVSMAPAAGQRKKESISEESFYKKRNEIPKFERELGPRKRGRPPRSSAPSATIISKLRQKEPECLTLSSDDDDEDDDGSGSRKKSTAQNKSAGNLISSSGLANDEIDLISEKEPVITNSKAASQEPSFSPSQNPEPSSLEKNNGDAMETEDSGNFNVKLETSFTCRTVRIGSYKYVPREKIFLSRNGLKLVVPLLEDQNQNVTINVKASEVVKVLIHFGKSMPVLFFYTNPNCGANIRELLGMQDAKGPYFDPAGKDQTHKRITLLPDKISEEARNICKQIFPAGSKMEELNAKEANDILVRASPKDNSQMIVKKKQLVSVASNSSNIVNGRPNEPIVQKLTVYPPPPAKSGIAINTEDYSCLGEDQFLNDVIIDFYLKYLTLQVLSEADQHRTHVFSSYFYKRLTSRHAQSADATNSVSPAAKRHARVQKWTKNVNIFEKDFIIIPINEHAHWFLAIICYPGLVGTVLPPAPVKDPEAKKSKKKEVKVQTLTIGSTTITPVATPTITIDQNDEDSERDEAEGDEDEMDMDSEEDDEAGEDSEGNSAKVSITPVEKPAAASQNEEPTVKAPCILIFDSLKGASRSRVVATLRDYLSCEYQAKLGREKVFSKDTIKGGCPKVPQQSNFTDCGLYLLQYVESFFKDPIKDYTLPIKSVKNWFEEIVVTRKREELSNLLIKLMNETNGDKKIILPSVQFPTQDGKLKPKSETSDKSDLKGQKESEAKKSKAEDDQSNANNNQQPDLQDTPTRAVKTFVAILPCSSTTYNSGESNTVGMVVTKTPTTVAPMSFLRTKRIPRLIQKETESSPADASPAVPPKKHKGDSLDSCK